LASATVAVVAAAALTAAVVAPVVAVAALSPADRSLSAAVRRCFAPMDI